MDLIVNDPSDRDDTYSRPAGLASGVSSGSTEGHDHFVFTVACPELFSVTFPVRQVGVMSS